MPAYPDYMNVREGKVLLTEADWPTDYGRKFGLLLVGAGTALRNTDHFFGGSGSVQMNTGAVIGNLTEVKVNFPNIEPGPKIFAFEQKFISDLQFGANHFYSGIENRLSVSPFRRGQIRYTVTGDALEYESSQDTYTPLPGNPPAMERSFLSAANGAGDIWAWTRLVVDFDKNEYVKVQYLSTEGFQEVDMSGIPLPEITTGDTITALLTFVFGETPANTATTYYSTDWALTRVP